MVYHDPKSITGETLMLPLVELPEIVRHYTAWFEPVFSDEEALIQFQRYLSGLLVSENKTASYSHKASSF